MKQRSGWLTRHWHRSTHIRLLAFLCLSLFFCALPLFVWTCEVNCGPSALGFSARGGLEVKQRLISFFWKVFSSLFPFLMWESWCNQIWKGLNSWMSHTVESKRLRRHWKSHFLVTLRIHWSCLFFVHMLRFSCFYWNMLWSIKCSIQNI